MRYPEFLSEGGIIGFVAPSFGCATEPYKTAFGMTIKRFEKEGYLLRHDRKSYRHQPQKQGEKSDFSAHINLNLLSLSSPKVINAIQRPKYYKNFFC